MMARGVLRPTGKARERFQLHANRYRFGAGHALKLELLGSDAPYLRPSSASFALEISDLRLKLPVRRRGRKTLDFTTA